MSGLGNGGFLKTTGIKFNDTAVLDAFGRLRVTSPFTVFDFKPLYDKGSFVFDEVVFGTSSSVHNVEKPSIDLTVSTANDYVIRQTKSHNNYSPAKSMVYVITASHFDIQSNIIKRIGAIISSFSVPHNVSNGLFFESNGVDGYVSVNVVSNGATNSVPQSLWNLDTMDGTGPSGINVDWSKGHIFHIDFQWLGFGRVRFGLNIGGQLMYIHEFNHSNIVDKPYISVSNLAVHYSIRSFGGPGFLSTICSAVFIENSSEVIGKNRAISNGITAFNASASGTDYAVLGLSLKNTTHDASIIIEKLNILITTNDNFRYSLCLNPTIAGTFTFSDLSDSVVRAAIGATANTVSNRGLIIDEAYGSQISGLSLSNVSNALRLGHTIAGVMDRLVLVLTPLANNMSVFASITWRELI